MTLKEALNFIDIGNQPILLSDKNCKEYYYHSVEELQSDEQYKELSQLKVVNIDADGWQDTVVFYLW